jgi:hypothetical protein
MTDERDIPDRVSVIVPGVILLSTNRGTGLASEEVGMHSLQLFMILAAHVLAGRSAGRARQDFIT